MSKRTPKQVLKQTIQITAAIVVYLYLPIYLSFLKTIIPFKITIMFFLSSVVIVAVVYRKYLNKKYELDYIKGQVQEQLNIAETQNNKELDNNLGLQFKILRYNNLEKVLNEINQVLDVDLVAQSLVSAAFSLIANKKGGCLFYLVNNQTQKLNLIRSDKENRSLIIKEKEGDIFDLWVLKHTSPLLIEDVKNDFRFDLDKMKQRNLRNVASLISSGLISQNNFLGILRMDNEEPNFYTQDDLRFLVKICELGSVALENSQLFYHTRQLAIHDELTSLYTKGYFIEQLSQECKRRAKNKDRFSLLMLDIDYFKKYNDKFGHVAGDIVLKKIGNILLDFFKGSTVLACRFGGEEFSVLLFGKDKKEAVLMAEDLRKAIEKERIILRREESSVTVSIGISGFPEDAALEDGLLQSADKAMYMAKAKGRNKVCCL